jgi:hypothetical protein
VVRSQRYGMMEVEPLVKYAYTHPPRCISALRPEPIQQPLLGMERDQCLAYFRVGCPCGENPIFVLGYHAVDEGQSAEDIFIGPLGIECPRCGRTSELMDPRTDGYDREIGANCNMSGEGERSRFPCPTCKASPMLVMPGFSYQFSNIERWSEDIRQRPQDFFDGFLLYGGCIRCKAIVLITEFECA